MKNSCYSIERRLCLRLFLFFALYAIIGFAVLLLSNYVLEVFPSSVCTWISQRLDVLFALYLIIGFSGIFYFYWKKPWGYLNEVMNATEIVYEQNDHTIELSEPLRAVENQMNQIKMSVLLSQQAASLVTEQPAYYSGDFVSPEQILPPEGIRNVCGERVPWELCTTMNNNWGYNPYDTDYKPAAMLIRKLVECVSKGGNMILNVGPDANGRFNLESCRLLDDIGAWLAVNGESIYGCGSADVPKPDWGWYTKKDGRIYAHILENPIGPLALTGLDAKRVGAVRRLADGSEVLRGESWITNAYENLAFVTLGTIPHFTYMLPDPTDTVLEIEYKDACL